MSIPMSPQYLMYYIPLLIGVSLVLAGTKHEHASLILRQAISTAFWFTVFMLIVAVVLIVAMFFI
jgi:hypothetical protein